MSSWKWTPSRNEGIWRYGAIWAKPLVVAAPFLTIGLFVLMFTVIGGTFASAKGTLFDLIEGDMAEGETTDLVALVMPMSHETLVFFDDARYMLGDTASTSALIDHLTLRLKGTPRKTMLVLADRRVAGGDLVKFAEIARKGGVERVLLAERKASNAE